MIVEPKLAVPESVGSDESANGSFVAEVATDQWFVIPIELVFVVLAVIKLPASAET